ncbi:MAG: hypothetical protein VYB30_01985 [Candidatus Thermoplasmatota archaeon]|nr:hypothetical protein [Candidatus Thermoplasmatota archaeon]
MKMKGEEIRGILRPLCDDIQDQISYNREERDQWNSKVRKLLDERNELNRQVKELITEVQNQKALRDDANQTVRELKEIRADRTEKLRVVRTNFREKIAENGAREERKEKQDKTRSPGRIRAEIDRLEKQYNEGRFLGKKEREFVAKMKKLHQELRESKEKKSDGGIRELKIQLRDAEKKQEDAHKKVKRAVFGAQEAHDLMAELSEEVDRLRGKANSAQSGVTRAKREADSLHGRYIVSLRCIHSMQDLLKALESREGGTSEEEEQVEVADLMTRLMSGDTLSTDEIMALQRN